MSDTRTTATATTPAAKLGRVRESSVGLVFMLIIQFILGIVYNLYGTMTPGTSIGLFSNGWLIAHEIWSILLLAAAISLVIRAMGTDNGRARALSWIGLVAIIGAIGAGLSFTSNTAAGASLGMSLAFAVALACYFILVFRLPSGES
jgi:hypothetical protein